MAHTGRPGDIPSVCIAPAFRQVVRFGTSRPFLLTCLCLYAPQLLAAPACSVFVFAVFPCSHGRTSVHAAPFGTTEWNHSYYTASSLSALHSLQQLHAGASSPSPVQTSASTRQSHDAAPSSSVPCPQATLSATHPQVRTGPTCTITNSLLSAALAAAATQLSFAAFLERCIFVNASPTPSLDAAAQTFSHTVASRDASTQLSFREFLAPHSVFDIRCDACAQLVPSLPLDAAVQTPLHSVATHDASRQLPLTEFFIGCIFSNDPLVLQGSSSVHCDAGSASPP